MARVSKIKESPEPSAAAAPAEDPKALHLYSVRLPVSTPGSRRRKINLGDRGVYLFDADVTGKEQKKRPGYPLHRIRLNAREARQLASDGYDVNPLSKDEAEKPNAGSNALDSAVAEARAKAQE